MFKNTFFYKTAPVAACDYWLLFQNDIRTKIRKTYSNKLKKRRNETRNWCITASCYNKFTGLNGIILWTFSWYEKSSNCIQCWVPSPPAELPTVTKPIGVRYIDPWWRISNKISHSDKRSLLKSNWNVSLNTGCLLLFWIVLLRLLTRLLPKYKLALTETSKMVKTDITHCNKKWSSLLKISL